MRSYEAVKLFFEANGWRCGFLPATLGRRYSTVDFQFSWLVPWLRSLLHPEVRDGKLCVGGVEAGRYVCVPSPMDLGPDALLRCGGYSVWECLFSSYDAVCAIVWNGKTAFPRRWAAFWSPPRHSGWAVSNNRNSISVAWWMAAKFALSGGARLLPMPRRVVGSVGASSSSDRS